MRRKIGSFIILVQIFTMTGYVTALEKNMKVCKCDYHEAGHDHENCDCGMCEMNHDKKNISKFYIKNAPCHQEKNTPEAVIYGADLFIAPVEKYIQADKKEFIKKLQSKKIESVILDRFDKPS